MIKIKVVSDTICPWCYIGKRNFDKALLLLTIFVFIPSHNLYI